MMRRTHEGDWLLSEVVGADRNVTEMTDRLLAETSVIVVGPLGSGKTHLTRAVLAELHQRQLDPVVVHGAAPLSAIPFGAIRAAADERLDGLRDLSPTDGAPLLVLVDDAQALDPDSLDLLCQAIYTGHARLLLSVTADPLGTSRSGGTPEAIMRLWLEGEAARYDLRELDVATADSLISEFVGADLLDTVTRVVLFTRSGGSRRLLRELTTAAAAEEVAGREPLNPSQDVLPGSRLSDTLASMVADYRPEECLALALVGRLRGVEFVTACRTIDPEVLESLIQRRVLRTDRLPTQSLYANRTLAREAERRLPPGRLDAALDAVVARALAHPETPSGSAVDARNATRGLAQRPGVPGPLDVDPDARCRILSTAAGTANSEGRPDLALAYVRLGLEGGNCPGLLLESSRAQAGLRRFEEAYAPLRVLPASAMSLHDVRRMVRWWGTLVTWTPSGHGIGEVEEWLEASGISEPSVRAELDLQRAESACLDMDWERAVELATRVLTSSGARVLTRLRAAVTCGFAQAQLGRFDEAFATFTLAEKANRDPMTGKPVSIGSELAVLCFEAVAGLLADRRMPRHPERLLALTLDAAEREDRGAQALASIVSGLVLGLAAGDVERTSRDFEHAFGRFGRIEFAVWRPILIYLAINELARRGHLEEAREMFARIDEQVLAQHRFYRYARLTALAELLAASGDLDGARRTMQAGVRERSFHLPQEVPHRRDTERLARFERVAASALGAAAALAATDPAAASGSAHAPGDDPSATPERSAERPAVELTERELEIAQLVARQLSNKEIAQRLFLSVRTVESHVYTARGKLNARSRRELGRMVGVADPSATGHGPGPVD
ncbi:MAG: LuxR C-terminal-related transcriptional regulator [Herbiconiux sp.]|nr:LuxR C-terminal-related transcriptional regulator [Herbiconiux sp.]